MALQVYFVYAAILYLFFATVITNELASALNIRIFRVKEIKNENVEKEQA